METVCLRLEQVEADFALLEAWSLKYQYLMDLGREMVPLEEHGRTADTSVAGCSSPLWLQAGLEAGQRRVRAWSPSTVPLGLAGLVVRLFDGTVPADPAGASPDPDSETIIRRLGLHGNLSHTRLTTLRRMINRARQAGLPGAGA